MIRVLAHLGGVHPAALALAALGLGDGHGQTGIGGALTGDGAVLGTAGGHLAVRDDEQLRQVQSGGLHEDGSGGVIAGVEGHMGLQGLADLLLGTGGLQHGVHVVAQGLHHAPLGHGGLAEGVVGEGLVHLVEHHVALVVTGAVGPWTARSRRR